MKRLWGFGTLLASCLTASGTTTHFDNLHLPSAQSFWNGSDLSGGFSLQNIRFGNGYNPDWFSWWGFAYSNIDNTNTPGWANQYASWSGSDLSGTGNYAIVFDDAYSPEKDVVTFPVETRVQGFHINNATYPALSMRDGDLFAKKFGGPSGNDPDWFLLTVTGADSSGQNCGTTTFYLADFRFTNNAQDDIVGSWTWLSLTNLGHRVKTLHFALSSSDNGGFGMNTPAYFAMDDLVADLAYAPPPPATNSTAISMTSTLFRAWATGWTNYQPGAECDLAWQTPELATGTAQGAAFNIVCLGNGGQITMTFNQPIANGSGPDFAVFENAFEDDFLELAWTEVSSDGQNFHRFPTHSLTVSNVPAFGQVFATNLIGFAGKYRAGFGTPFDLDELPATPGLDKNSIRFVRLVDIVGDGASTDSFGNAIFDPHPTVSSAGFDLDAIGVLHTRVEIEAVASGSGTLSPSGLIYAATESDFTFSIQPAPYHNIATLAVDELTAPPTNLFTFTNLQSNHTLEVEFVALTTSNQVPHWWLASHGLTNADFEVAAGDDGDHDGFSSEEEFFTGTEPTNADSFFMVADLLPGVASNRLEWLSPTGTPAAVFSVEGRPGSIGGPFTLLTNSIPQSPTGTNRWHHPVTNGNPWFYRVIVQPR